MKIYDPSCNDVREEMAVLEEVLAPLSAQGRLHDILEIGCGTGDMTRRIAQAWPHVRLCAMEVDRVQLEKNQQRNRHENITYIEGPAERIPHPDQSFDAVLMFKSLHHVPMSVLDRALDEIHRVLRPGGIAYFAEPVFAGDLNEIIRLFHDEQAVRSGAFDALMRAAGNAHWQRASETHYLVAVRFENFEDFERKVMRVTHSDFGLTPQKVDQVRSAFEPYVSNEGAHFVRPMRANALVKGVQG